MLQVFYEGITYLESGYIFKVNPFWPKLGIYVKKAPLSEFGQTKSMVIRNTKFFSHFVCYFN